jgi:hypothetical protein
VSTKNTKNTKGGKDGKGAEGFEFGNQETRKGEGTKVWRERRGEGVSRKKGEDAMDDAGGPKIVLGAALGERCELRSKS